MRISFAVVISIHAVLLPTLLLCMLLPVLLTFSNRTHLDLLKLSAREVALKMTQTVAARLDSAFHQTQSAMRVAQRIGAHPHAASPPAINSQSYTPAQITALGLDKLRYAKNLWLEKETRIMEQYNSAYTYLSFLETPLPTQLNATGYDSQILTCRNEDGDDVSLKSVLQRGQLAGNTQMHMMQASAGTQEIPINLTGFGMWDEKLRPLRRSGNNNNDRDHVFSVLAAGAQVTFMSLLPPNGRVWLTLKELGLAVQAAAEEAASSGNRVPVITAQLMSVLEKNFARAGAGLFNRSFVAAFAPYLYRSAQPQKQPGLAGTRCAAVLLAPTLLDAAIHNFFDIAGYPANHYAPFDLLANQANPASSLEEAVARDVAARKRENSEQQQQPVFYFIDGLGNPIHSTEGTLYAEFRSTLASALERHPMESVSGCSGIPFPKYDGSPGLERIISCRKNVTDDGQFVLLSQLRQSLEANVSDIHTAMLAANRSAALLRSRHTNKVADLAIEFRATTVVDPRDGTRYEVTIAPLVTEDPNLWHYSLVVFTPENFRRGDIDTRRNVSIGIAAAICLVAVIATVFATTIISRHISDITLQMADPLGLNTFRRGRTTMMTAPVQSGAVDLVNNDSPVSPFVGVGVSMPALQSAFSCFAQFFEQLIELDEVGAAFVECRETVQQLRGFVNQDALLFLRNSSNNGKRPGDNKNNSNGNNNNKTENSESYNNENSMSQSYPSLSRNNSSGMMCQNNSDHAAAIASSADADESLTPRASRQPDTKKKKKAVRFSAPEQDSVVTAFVDDAGAIDRRIIITAPPPSTTQQFADNGSESATSSSASDVEDQSGGAAASGDNAAAQRPQLRRIPRRRPAQPAHDNLRFYGCVVVNFLIVQRVYNSRNLLREVTAAAADMCHSLLTRLPVMAIEQFLGDGLICATHIRRLQRPSRTLSTVVEQLIRECKLFEKRIDDMARSEEALKLGTSAGTNADGVETAAAAVIAATPAVPVTTESIRRHLEETKHVPLVAVGIFCGSLRMSHRQISTVDNNSINSNTIDNSLDRSDESRGDPLLRPSVFVAPSRTARATTFLGPLIAHAERLCRERSAVAPTTVRFSHRDPGADTQVFSLTLAEQLLLSGGTPTDGRSVLTVRFGERTLPLFGLRDAFKRKMTEGDEHVSNWGIHNARPQQQLGVPDNDDDPLFRSDEDLSLTQHWLNEERRARYAIVIPRCFAGLCFRRASTILKSELGNNNNNNNNNSAGSPCAAATAATAPSTSAAKRAAIALRCEPDQQFLVLKSTSALGVEIEAMFALCRIVSSCDAEDEDE